jgi:hypothetical protein
MILPGMELEVKGLVFYCGTTCPPASLLILIPHSPPLPSRDNVSLLQSFLSCLFVRREVRDTTNKVS